MHSISSRGPLYAPGQHMQHGYESTPDSDLWLAFLTEAGQKEASEMAIGSSTRHFITFWYRFHRDD